MSWMRNAGTAMAAACAACATCAGCKASRPSSGEPSPAASTVPVTAPALPADHLAPGELLEGSEHAFGLTLPQGLRVDEGFVRVTYASGPLSVHPLVEYFRARLRDGELHEGETSATFDHVTVPGKPEPPLSIHIATLRDSVRVEIRDETPPVVPALPDDAARWKHAGLTPSGRVLDPTHLD